MKKRRIVNPRIVKPGVIAAWLAAATLAGCVVTPAHYYVGGTVHVAPPPPREEVIDIAPSPGYVWIGGYWNWTGERHVWMPGHWVAPRRGYHWVSHRWERVGDGWRMAPGHWEHER